MAVVLRLKRKGNKHRPFYHIVAADERARRDGRFIEKLGVYNPLGETELAIDEAVAQKWIAEGAKISPRVKSLLQRAGVGQATP